ncbi:MAG: B12-binding domain-containing protein [Gammaproteobacteria bacterium]|nr:B12-binding domain-containing protein [Gammaproteobacteria bacterium]
MNSMDLAAPLRERTNAITEAVIEADYSRRPELLARYGERGRSYYKRDNDYHLSFLAEAVANEDSALFIDYVAWARSMLTSHGVLLEDLVNNLKLLKEAIQYQVIDQETVARAIEPIDLALEQLPSIADAPPSFMSSELRNGDLAEEFLQLLLRADRRKASELVSRAVDNNVPLKQIYLDVFQRSQREIGRLWQLNQISVAEEHYCTAATLAIMNQFYPAILKTPRRGTRAVCCCVEGDLHEIGLRILADFMELEGWDCDYVGANTPGLELLKMLEKAPPDLIAISLR